MEIRSLAYDAIGVAAASVYLGGLVVGALTLPAISLCGVIVTTLKVAYHASQCFYLKKTMNHASDITARKIKIIQQEEAMYRTLDWLSVWGWGLIPWIGHKAILNKINEIPKETYRPIHANGDPASVV